MPGGLPKLWLHKENSIPKAFMLDLWDAVSCYFALPANLWYDLMP